MKLGTERDVLLLDGDCGLCHRLAIFMDKRKRLDADIAFRPIEHSLSINCKISTSNFQASCFMCSSWKLTVQGESC